MFFIRQIIQRLCLKAFFVGAFCAFFSVAITAQDLPEFSMADTTITICEGILYDSGGEDGIYGISENLTTVINPGGIITLTFFNQFCLEQNLDFLYIYDGPDASSPLLGQFTGTTLPPTFVTTGGSVTLVLTSDINVSYCGFSMQWESEHLPPVPPAITVTSIPTCGTSLVNVNFSTPIQCEWLDDAVFSLNAGGNEFDVASVAPNCSGGQTSMVTLTLEEPFSFNCDYGVNLSIGIPDNCGLIYPFDLTTSFEFSNCGVSAEIVADTDTICPGQCAQLMVDVAGCFTYTYLWNNGLPASSGPHSVCPVTTTTYSVNITETETGSSAVETFTLVVETLDIITPAQTVCQSVPDIEMEAAGAGEWSGLGIESGTNLFDPDSANAGLNYVYFQTSGCIDSVAITITPIQTEDVTAACPGSAPFQLEATPVGGTWSGPNTTVSGMFDPVADGTYTAIYTLGSCADSLTINVGNIAGPFLLDTICQSIWYDTISFTPVGGIWSGPGIVDSTLGVYAPSSIAPGNAQLTYTINGCDQVFTVFIKEINIDAYHTVCPEEPALVLDTSPTPPGGTWHGSPGAILNTSLGTFDPGAFADNTNTYITYEATNGCVDTMFIYVLQTTVEVSVLNFCVDDGPMTLDDDLVGYALPEGGAWTGPGISSAGGIYTFNPATAGVGVFTIHYQKNTCSDAVVVTVFPSGLAVSSLEFCSTDDPVILQPGLASGGTWTGPGIVNENTGQFDPGIPDPGTFFVYWSTEAGCSDSISITIQEFEEANITGLGSNYCLQDVDITFSATPAGGTLSGSLSSFTFNPQTLGAGTYEVFYTYAAGVCEASQDSVTFEVHPPLSVNIPAVDDLCYGTGTTVQAIVTGGDGTSGYSFAWSTGATNIATINTGPLTQTTTVSVIVNDACPNPVSDSIVITVRPKIEIEITLNDTVCQGEMGSAFAEVISPPGDYSISWNGNPTNPLPAFAGTQRTVLITDTATGCSTDSTVTLPAYPAVVANFSVNPNTGCVSYEDRNDVGFIDLSSNGAVGTWDFGNGTTQDYTVGEVVNQSYNDPGAYTVSLDISNLAGCESSYAIELCILPAEPVFIPDIFSPNGDGHNDILFVRGFGLTKIDFRLYDRWGEEVFKTTDTAVGWDGSLRGQPASSGSYFYTFKASVGDNSKIDKSGEIALVR